MKKMENFNRLDVAAKLFPAVAGKNNSSVFRVSVILREEIDPQLLQIAVNMIYERFDLFFIRLRKGVFWNYFDKNHVHFTIEKENAPPCSTIYAHENKGFIIKVLYFGNRISVEAFHSITDGSGVIEYIKALIYYYITIKHEPIDDEGKIYRFNEFDNFCDEDSFVKNFSNLPKYKKSKAKKGVNSYRIKGVKFTKRGHRVVTGLISVVDLKAWCKDYGCTITAFLVAHLIAAIYEQKPKRKKASRPIVVSVPVNLRKIFNSDTLKNFFGVVNVSYNMNDETNFLELLSSVSEQLASSLNETDLGNASGQNVSFSNNTFLKHMPLIVKNVIVPVGFNFIGESKKTITVSNIGRIDFPTGIIPFIEHAEMVIYPTPKSPINCAVCSLEDKLAFSFTTAITDSSIIRSFFRNIAKKADGNITVYSNAWGEDDEQM